MSGKCWMEALELALHCSGLMRPLPRSDLHDGANDSVSAVSRHDTALRSHVRMDETERERHFKLCGVCFKLILACLTFLTDLPRSYRKETQFQLAYHTWGNWNRLVMYLSAGRFAHRYWYSAHVMSLVLAHLSHLQWNMFNLWNVTVSHLRYYVATCLSCYRTYPVF